MDFPHLNVIGRPENLKMSEISKKVNRQSISHDFISNKAVTLWLYNIAMENGLFVDDFPIKTSIYKGFSMAMLNNQMVV
jgi:hypothetical protein